jgi:hypothetical protein
MAAELVAECGLVLPRDRKLVRQLAFVRVGRQGDRGKFTVLHRGAAPEETTGAQRTFNDEARP